MTFLTESEKKEILPHAQNFLKHTKEYMKEIGDTFFLVGCHLYEAQIYNYVEALGYESIEQLAEKELDLGKSSTYNLINVFKRFCDRNEYGNHKAWIDPKYKNYKYSQLIEIEKIYSIPWNIEKIIPPSTPVRVLKEYIKYVNKNSGSYKPLPEWQAEQEQEPILSPTADNKQIEGQLSIEETTPDEPQTNKKTTASEKNNVAPNVETSSTVQTFGLRKSAKCARM